MRPPAKPKVLARRPASPNRLVSIHVDGAARGNPGPAGVGAVLTNGSGRKLKEVSIYLGEATNNVAESCALIVALQEALKFSPGEVKVFTDSELLARQVTGRYRVKNQQLQWLHVLIQSLLQGFGRFEICHIPREQNRHADRLASRAAAEGLKRGRAHPRKPAPPSPDSAQPTFW